MQPFSLTMIYNYIMHRKISAEIFLNLRKFIFSANYLVKCISDFVIIIHFMKRNETEHYKSNYKLSNVTKWYFYQNGMNIRRTRN